MARRPRGVLFAAGLQLLTALPFLLSIIVVWRYGADAQAAAEAELTRQRVPTSVLADHGISFGSNTAEIPIPTIGIGASPACDGQILVMEDMLGLNPNPPKFVRQYAQLGPAIEAAVKAYAEDVRERRFPGVENVYPMKKAQ